MPVTDTDAQCAPPSVDLNGCPIASMNTNPLCRESGATRDHCVRGPVDVHALTPAAACSVVAAPRSAANPIQAQANFRTEFRTDVKRFLIIRDKSVRDLTVLGAILFGRHEYAIYVLSVAAVSVVG
jgi:hypothetical protein